MQNTYRWLLVSSGWSPASSSEAGRRSSKGASGRVSYGLVFLYQFRLRTFVEGLSRRLVISHPNIMLDLPIQDAWASYCGASQVFVWLPRLGTLESLNYARKPSRRAPAIKEVPKHLPTVRRKRRTEIQKPRRILKRCTANQNPIPRLERRRLPQSFCVVTGPSLNTLLIQSIHCRRAQGVQGGTRDKTPYESLQTRSPRKPEHSRRTSKGTSHHLSKRSRRSN